MKGGKWWRGREWWGEEVVESEGRERGGERRRGAGVVGSDEGRGSNGGRRNDGGEAVGLCDGGRGKHWMVVIVVLAGCS